MSPLSHTFRFKYSWRTYQKRFLEGFETHKNDNHLHVVAPPGSGKTVLGLEMIGQISKKTLVLAPTLTIRNQWNERMLECFVADESSVDTSFDIKNPETLTFSTYQSLHSFYKNTLESSDEKLLAFFEAANIETIVLDEAHHLKNEWWKPLFSLKQLPECVLISLTATPPYDSENSEIAKYFELCGPIDMEIGVPELVKEGNLCPHQDYIYFSEPSKAQIQDIITYREQLLQFVLDLQKNEEFQQFITQHPFYSATETSLEEIFSQPELYSAMLIYLNSCGKIIPPEKTNVLGITTKKITYPSFNYHWVEALLQPLLVSEREVHLENEPLLSSIEKNLRKIGGFDKKRVNLEGEKKLYRSLSQSPNKLKSIVEIVKIESDAMQRNLRMVILSDYIRSEFMSINEASKLSEINKLGVIPIFQYLRLQLSNIPAVQESKIAVLTGSLVVVHQELVSELVKLLSEADFNQTPLSDTNFTVITPTSQGKKEIVSTITQLFEAGNIEILIGTKSLLGEGWDAPAINTLILASFVGSFVMSNQMRGRAIRVFPTNPLKVANIWHIACLDPTHEQGGVDVALLLRRFDAFCGVSLEGTPFIENGSDRFGILDANLQAASLNNKMKSLALKREAVSKRWNQAITEGAVLVRELKIEYGSKKRNVKPKKLLYQDVVKFAFLELLALVLITIPELFVKNIGAFLTRGMLYFFYAIASGFAFVFLPKLWKAIRLYLKFGRKDRQLRNIATSVLQAMCQKKMITTPEVQLRIRIETFEKGAISCYLLGATVQEELQFVTYLDEIIQTIDNPRYLIVQSNWLRKQLGYSNYYAVPGIFAEHKKDANLFLYYWRKHNGKKATMLFTRNREGRKTLLKARFQHFNDQTTIASKKALIWK